MIISCELIDNDYDDDVVPILACENDETKINKTAYLLYAIVIPILAEFGIFANFINALVFMRPRMTPSAFTYLAALSWFDCLSCILIALTSYARSLFMKKVFWIRMDFQYLIPLFSISTGSANLILVFLTLDRWIYLKNGLPQNPPKFCTPTKAKRNILLIIIFSITINIPYFFIFNITDNGSIEITWFYHSTYYMIHNWITFTMLGVFPGVFLMIGNTALIIISRNIANHSKSFKANRITGNSARKRYMNQTKLITTVVAVVFLYLFGELPAHFTSRKSVVNLLFRGDITKINFETWEAYEVGFTLLNALQLSFNIVIYAVINPAFMTEFFECLHNISDWFLKILFLDALSNCFRSMGSSIYDFICKRRKSLPNNASNNNNLNVSTYTSHSELETVENNNNNNNNNTSSSSSCAKTLTSDIVDLTITNNINFIALQIGQKFDNYSNYDYYNSKRKLRYDCDLKFWSYNECINFNENYYDNCICINKMRRHSLCW